MKSRREVFGGLGNWMFQSAYLYAQARKGEIPDIYVQDEKWFYPYGDEIRGLYRSNVEPIDMVSLHIRRGDYVNNPFYVDLTETDYYEKAIEQFPNETFLVFCADRQQGSDDKSDMEWVQEWLELKFPDRRFQYFQGKDEIEDWNTMTGCKGHILANSSFSWWAAFVSGNKTACPRDWFADGQTRISLQDSWIQV